MQRQRVFGFGCCAAAAVLPCVLLIIGEVVVPSKLTAKLHDALVDDKLADVEEWCGPDKWSQNVSIVLTVFNLTNAKELQTVTPAPKPHFEAIEVEFTQMGRSFNCSVLNGGEQVKAHDWSKWVPSNPDVYDWEIVQVNPAYLGTVGALAPSEKMLQLGLSHNILGSVRGALTLFAMGSLQANSGLTAGASAVMNETVTTPQDLAAAQFGASVVTNLQALALKQLPMSALPALGFTSVAVVPAMQKKGVCTPIELGTYMNTMAFASSSSLAGMLALKGFEFSSFSMSVGEAKAFLSRFSNATGASTVGAPNWPAALAMLAKKYLANLGDATASAFIDREIQGAFASTFGTLKVKAQNGAIVTGCSSSGGPMCAAVALAYAGYLTSYLPEQFFVGCQLLGCADGACMKDDGTYPLNSGLFTRLTLREMLHDGNADRLFKVAPAEAVPPGVKLEYNGLLGKHALMDASLDSVLAQEADLSAMSSVKLSGKTDITRIKEWVEYQGKAIVREGDASYPGWGNDGVPGEPFKFSGQHSLNNQAPQTTKNSPFAMSSQGHVSSPSFKSIDFLLSVVTRPVTLGCGSEGSANVFECKVHDVKGIHTNKFSVPADLLKTKKAGVVTEACRGTVSQSYAKTYPATTESGPTCDFLQRHDGVINMATARRGAPLAVTHGYLGQADATLRDAVSITRRGESSEIQYEPARDELALFVEPITGAVIAGYERLQMNWYVERSMIDSARYSNLFSAQTDNDDVFVWPFMYIKKEPSITDSGAKKFVEQIYGTYDLGFHLDLFGFVMAVVCVVSAALCFKFDHGKAGAPTPAQESSQTSV